jgi:hypothetical protein
MSGELSATGVITGTTAPLVDTIVVSVSATSPVSIR